MEKDPLAMEIKRKYCDNYLRELSNLKILKNFLSAAVQKLKPWKQKEVRTIIS